MSRHTHTGSNKHTHGHHSRREEKPSASKPSNSHTVAKQSSSGRRLSARPMKISVVIYNPKFKRMIYQDKKRQKELLRILPGLRKGYMMSEGSEGIELGFLNILDVEAYSDNIRLWVDIYLGDAQNGQTHHEVLLDTASALSWVSRESYVHPRNATQRQNLQPPQREQVRLDYATTGGLTGELYRDTMRLGEDDSFPIQNQLFAVIDTVPDNVMSSVRDGILAVGPKRLSQRTLVNRPNATIDTVLDNLYAQHGVSARIFGIAINPPDDSPEAVASQELFRGTIHFGGLRSEYELSSIPATQERPSSRFYGVNLALTLDQGGRRHDIMSQCPGTIDTGAFFTSLDGEILRGYMNRVGATYNSSMELWTLPIANQRNLGTLNFHFEGGAQVAFCPSAQVWPPAWNTYLDSNARSDTLYFTLREIHQSLPGKKFILGLSWITRYYVGFDLSNPIGVVIRLGRTRNTDKRWRGLTV